MTRTITLLSTLVLVLSGCSLSPRPAPLAKLKVDLSASFSPTFKGKCLEPFLATQDANYYTYLADPNSFDFDQTGILQYNYGGRFDNAGWQMPPFMLANFALTGVNAWCQRHDPVGLQLAIKHAHYFMDKAVRMDGFVTWSYPFPVSMFDIPTNFTSGLANAYILVLFTRLYAITGDPLYLDFAHQTANGFNVDTNAGGIRSLMPDGSYFFEEYAYPQAPTVHILNGHMAAVAALAYYGRYAPNPLALQWADQGIAAIRNHLKEYDAGIYSLYDLDRKIYVDYSQSIHIKYLFWLYRYTADPFFLQYAFRWQNYSRPDKYHLEVYGSSSSGDTDLLTKAVLALTDFQATLPGWPVSFELKDFVYFDLGKIKPVGSFSYFAQASPPTNYAISTSGDGQNWQKVIAATASPSEAVLNYCFPQGLTARYIHLGIDQVANNATTFKGAIRIDPPAYCDDAILLVTSTDLVLLDSMALSDADPTTSLDLTAGNTIYGDLRQPGKPTAFNLSGDPIHSQMQAWLEISNDLTHWTPLIPKNEAVDIILPGRISLPQTANSWQYFRLYLTAKPGSTHSVPIHTLSIEN